MQESETWLDIRRSRGGAFSTSSLSFENTSDSAETETECDARSSFIQVNSAGRKGAKGINHKMFGHLSHTAPER